MDSAGRVVIDTWERQLRLPGSTLAIPQRRPQCIYRCGTPPGRDLDEVQHSYWCIRHAGAGSMPLAKFYKRTKQGCIRPSQAALSCAGPVEERQNSVLFGNWLSVPSLRAGGKQSRIWQQDALQISPGRVSHRDIWLKGEEWGGNSR